MCVCVCVYSYFCVFLANESFLDISPIPGKWFIRCNDKNTSLMGTHLDQEHRLVYVPDNVLIQGTSPMTQCSQSSKDHCKTNKDHT